MIYSLKDIDEPVIKYTNPPLTFIDYAFVIRLQKGLTYFILKSWYQNSHVEIKWSNLGAIFIDE